MNNLHFRTIEDCLAKAGLNPRQVEGWRLVEPEFIRHQTFGWVSGHVVATDGVHVLILFAEGRVFDAHITNVDLQQFRKRKHQTVPRRQRTSKADLEAAIEGLVQACQNQNQ